MTNVQLSQIQSLAPRMADQYRQAFSSPDANATLAKYGISNNPLRVCHFLAQVLTETGALRFLRESLYYSAPQLMKTWPKRFPTLDIANQYAQNEEKLGNFVYGGRLGNINPGDGFLFRGRGLLQITGRTAYTRFGAQLGIPLTDNPDLAFDPDDCLEIAAAEWAVSGCNGKYCNELADDDDITGITYAINGGQNGIADRIAWLGRAKAVWLAQPSVPIAAISSRALANIDAGSAAGAEDPRIATVTQANLTLGGGAPPAGTLRPFDAATAALCGQFVEAAYAMYSSAPGSTTPPPSAHFPAGYKLAAWIQMQDFVLESLDPLFYGLVAQSTTDASQFVVAIRGTSNGVEWWDDANAALKTPFKIPGCGAVGKGFARIYDTLEVIECTTGAAGAPGAAARQSLRSAGTFSQQISELLQRHGPPAPATARPGAFPSSASVKVTGHSLGAALATLYTMENAHTDQIANPLLCTFASPLVGDSMFASTFNALDLTSWRVVNAPDLVPKLPPEILGFVHVNALEPFDSAGTVKRSLGCWHSMATYLSLIDPTQSPDVGCQNIAVPAPAGRRSSATTRRSSAIRGKAPTGFTGSVRKIAWYGWKPDLPDQRDHSYAVPPTVMQNISGDVDLRPQCPPVYNQGRIGSCTANAIAAAIEFDMMKQRLPSFTPSRLFIYYNERSMEGTIGSDAGAFIRDGIKSVASQGDCPETLWPYSDTPAQQPSGIFPPDAPAGQPPRPECYANAIHHTALTYQSVDQNLADMKGCLAAGYPFIFGFTVYPSFESDDVRSSGILPMPGADETTIGGHAVLAVGYDDTKNMFIVRNSWGLGWGIDGSGYFYMPYAYLLDNNLANDFWTVRVVA